MTLLCCEKGSKGKTCYFRSHDFKEKSVYLDGE